MALIDDIKLNLRVSTKALDPEIRMLIDSAVADMIRVGVDPEYINIEDEIPPLVKHAITCYCKAHFGYDEPDAERFNASYRQLVADMLNSSVNIAAKARND